MHSALAYSVIEGAAAEIASLETLDVERLRTRWREIYGREAPRKLSRELLVGGVAYRLQELVLGGLTPEIRGLLTRAVNTNSHGHREPRGRGRCSLKPGTVLFREWRGVNHRVIVLHGGQLRYQGRCYRSLSEIARMITGTRWSGPLFFGLKKVVHA